MHQDALAGSKRVIALSAAAATLAACSAKSDKPVVDTTTPASASAPAPAPTTTAPSTDASSMVRGTVASINGTDVVVKTDSSSTTVHLTQPVTVYARSSATLADVKDNTFIGVTTVKQPDGSERATEIHIFPDALRGLGEGSRMMDNAGAAPGSRMTNGAVASGGSRMTNGSVSGSRMTNGTTSAANGSTMVVSYAGGSTNVSIPPTVTVTEIKAVPRQVAVGDQVAVMTTKAADGSLSTSKILISK